MQASVARWRERVMHAWRFVASNRQMAAFACVAVVVGVFAVAMPAHAGMPEAKEWILLMIADLIGWIILLLGKLIILVANILVAVAQYNNFVKSNAVTLGWPLVRDVVNMFFIVVLLVVAFGTIVRYKEFHYTAVLPKLLLMAILINFSKTLIGLLIDFSQVITLTFVSAFQQAAGGNFITAFKLTKMTALSTDQRRGDPEPNTVPELIVASMLAAILMTVALVTLVVMAVFFMFRIVALWILLILSPIAFFALALPSKMSKAVAPFTNKWWERLSTMLVAGPVMAFFLWLGLAIAQGDKPFLDTLGTTGNEETKGIDSSKFSTQVGTVEELGTFLVAIVFMLTGLQFAMETSKSVPGMGSALGAIRSAPRRAAGIAYGTARIAGKGAKLGFEGVDRVADVRGLVGRNMLKVSGAMGGVGAATFAGMAGHRGERIKAKQAQLKKVTENLDEKTAQKFLRGRASSKIFTREAAAAQMALADRASNSLSQKTLRDKYYEELKTERPDITNDAERMALATSKAKQQRGTDLKAGKDVAGRFGFDEKMEKYVDVLKKDVGLSGDWTDAADVKNGSVTDIGKYLSGVSASLAQDSLPLLAHLNAVGGINKDGTFNKESEGYKKFMVGGRGENAKPIVETLTPQQVQAQLAVMDGKAVEGMSVEETLKFANESRMSSARHNGEIGSVFVNLTAQPERAKGETPDDKQAREERMSRARDRVQTFVDRGPEAAASSEAQNARFELLAVGGKISQAFNYDEKKGEFADDNQRALFDESLQTLRDGVGRGDEQTLRVITQFDTSALKAQPGAYNEARSAMVMEMTPEVLMQGYQQANRGGNEAAKGKVKELIDVVATEAERVKKIAADAKISIEDLQKVAKSPMSSDSEKIKRKLISGGYAKNERAADAMARAVVSGQAIENDEGMREIRGDRSQKAQSRVDAARARTNRGRGAKT